MSGKATEASLRPEDVVFPVQEDLEKVEAELKELTRSTSPLIHDINRYLHESGGKRLRPAVLLLCSRLFGHQGREVVRLAAVVELIHVATLVHDDIIDNADMRRGRASVNAHWGNQITVLMGDWLYMTSFQLALKLRNFRILDILIDITRNMVEGELLQLERQWKLDVSVKEHVEICFRKTARLFEGCGRLAAVAAGADGDAEDRLADYGRFLGMTFQLTDDLLDYTSSAAVLGKPVLKDLQEGKVTLPIIHLLERAAPRERTFVEDVVRERNFAPENKRRIISLVEQYGTLDEVRSLAHSYARRAHDSLTGFEDGACRQTLLRLPSFITRRAW